MYHIVSQHHAGDYTLELVGRSVDSGIQLGVARHILEPRHHFESVVNHLEERIGKRYRGKRFEAVGIDAAVGGIELVQGKQRGMRKKLFGELFVGDNQCQQPAETQIIVCLDQVGLGNGFKTYNLDNLAYIIYRQ